VLLKVLSKLNVEAQEGGDDEAEKLFDGLRHLVYAKRTPPILAEAEQKIVNMLRILYPSLQKGILSIHIAQPKKTSPTSLFYVVLTDENFLRILSMINLNSLSVETHAFSLKITHQLGTPEEYKRGRAGRRDDTEEEEGGPDINLDENPDAGVNVLPSINQKDAIRGTSIFAVASMMNNSCDGNIVAVEPLLDGHNTTFLAYRDIKKDEELFFSYASTPDVEVRRRRLFCTYHFWCQCSLCVQQQKELEEQS